VVVCTYFLNPAVYGQLGGLLAPGGLAIVVHPTRRNLERHASPRPSYLVEEGALPDLVTGPQVAVVRYHEGWSLPGPGGRHEASLVVRRVA
jgi:hypothetical protein